MNFKKLFSSLFFITVFGFILNFNALDAGAMTVSEIQNLITQLQQQIATLQSQLTAAEGGEAAWCHDFNSNLRIGDSNADVRALRSALTKEGFSGLEVMDGTYELDERITAAVVGFQEKYKDEILTPFGLQRGTGFVGKSTRNKLNKLFGCGNTDTDTNTTTSTVTVISPNGGETFVQGSPITIRWSAANLPTNLTYVHLYLSPSVFVGVSAGRPDGMIEASINCNGAVYSPDTSYIWDGKIICSGGEQFVLPTGDYKITARLYSWPNTKNPGIEVASDDSDNYFSIIATPATTTPSILPAPEMVYPVNNQALNYGSPYGYMFKVKPVTGASGYLFGFFQNDIMVYENWRDDRELSPNGEFAIWPENKYYSTIKEGNLEVWVRALVNNEWSEAKVITVELANRR